MPVRKVVKRTRSGSYQVNLGPGERRVLASLAPQLRQLLADPDQPGLRRLFPPAYGADADAEHQEEYRRLMTEDLVERHGAALDTLASTAEAEELTAEQVEAWMLALNHLRLVIGTRLDVTEEDEPAGDDPEHQLYYFLGYLQESVVQALSA
jgi:hypothetical protein